MGLASALSTALTGLSASETTIDVVGNNLANSSTVGFKESQATFATQFLQTQSLGSGPTDASGGTNPRQVGLGTMVAEITPNFTQGTVSTTSSSSDLAIQGDGFFIVAANNGGNIYTRNGEFKLNADNELTTATGNRLLGYGVNSQYEIQTTALEPITIPLGSAAVAKATENAYLQGTLSPTGDLADAAKIIQTGVLGDGIYTSPDATQIQTNVHIAPDVSSIGVAASATAGSVGAGTYVYKLLYANGPPASTTTNNLESTPSAATAQVTIDGTTQTAIDLSNLNSMKAGAGDYQYINIYRATVDGGPGGTVGTYSYLDQVDVSTITSATIYTDKKLSGSDALNDTVLTGQHTYYVAFHNTITGATSCPTLIGTETVSNGRIEITNLPADSSGNWDSWVIYRNAPTSAGGTDTYIEDTTTSIPFTSITPYFTDNTSDADLYQNYLDDPTKIIDMDGPKIQKTTLLDEVRQYNGTTGTYQNIFTDGSTLEFTGQKGSVTLDSKNLSVTPATTVNDLLNFMQESLGIQPSNATTGIPGSLDLANPTWPPIPPGADLLNGQIRITGNNGVANAVGVKSITDSNKNPINLSFSTYQDAEGEGVSTNFNVYDSLGISCSVQLTAVLQSHDDKTTTYRWFADSKDNQLASGSPEIAVGSGVIKFDGEGNFISSTNDSISINRDNVASKSPLQVKLDFNAISGLQTSQSTVQLKSQDGNAPGVLSSYIVAENGLVSGVFSNGITRDLAQIRLARFSNPAGLEQLGQNMYAAGVNSGLPVEGNPGEQGIGSLVAGAVELSNADVGSNLIDLILASTMYRSNTKVITTVQTMLDTLLQLQR